MVLLNHQIYLRSFALEVQDRWGVPFKLHHQEVIN